MIIFSTTGRVQPHASCSITAMTQDDMVIPVNNNMVIHLSLSVELLNKRKLTLTVSTDTVNDCEFC